MQNHPKNVCAAPVVFVNVITPGGEDDAAPETMVGVGQPPTVCLVYPDQAASLAVKADNTVVAVTAVFAVNKPHCNSAIYAVCCSSSSISPLFTII
jgi:hypothetical protein